MAYSEEIKNKVLVSLANNIDIKDIASKLNISISTIYRWKKENVDEIAIIKVSLKLRELIKSGNYLEAFELASEERFKKDFLVQSQRITCLIKLGRVKEALELASKERFKNYFPIQSQRITCLIKLGRVKEALELTSEDRLKDNFTIQSQRITCLIKLGRVKEALELTSEERFKNAFPIQSQKITCLINLGKVKEAFELATEERFKNYFPIQSQRITCLINLGRVKEALELASEERFKNYLPIQNQRKTLQKEKKCDEASFDSIFFNLINKRLDLAFKLLNKYLKNINGSVFEFLIIDLIKLSVLIGDCFTTPMSILSLISRNEYVFNINVYIAYFYKALEAGEIQEAKIYLDIIKSGRKLTTLDEKVVFELNEELEKAKLRLPSFVEDIIREVREKQEPILLPLMSNALTNKVKVFILKSNDIKPYIIDVDGNRRLVLRYNAPYKFIDIKGLEAKQKEFYYKSDYEQSIKIGLEILRYVNRYNSYAYIGLAYYELGNLEQAIMYLKITTYLDGSLNNFKELINQLEKEQEREIANYNPNVEFDETEFSSNNYYGLTDMEGIFIMVLEENIPIDNACQAFRLNPYNTILAKILLAREYYAEGMDFLAERIIKEVSASPIKNELIQKVLEETIRNKKLYRNKGSILARLKES